MTRKGMVVLLALLVLFAAIPIVLTAAVNNQPIAVAKVNPEKFYACECEGVELDGSRSYDLDGGRIVKYEWLYNNKVVARGMKTTLGETFTRKSGGYNIILRVTDDGEDGTMINQSTDTIEVTFHVKHNPRPQIEELDWDIETEAENDEEFLVQGDKLPIEVDLVDDKEYGEITYNWSYNPKVFRQIKSHQTRYGQETTFEVISGGTGWKTSYEIGVTASNACGDKDTDDIEVEVKSSQSNQPPEAEIILPKRIDEGESFQARFSYTTGRERNESDDEIVNCSWVLRNEQKEVLDDSSNENPYFEIGDSGVFNISLTITDRFGAQGKASEDFEVEEYENDKPTADASATGITAVHGEPFKLDGSRSWDSDGPAEDYIGWYIWYIRIQIEGKGILREIGRSKSPVYLTTFNRTGKWGIILEVRDTGSKVEEGDDEIEILFHRNEIEITVIAPPEPTPAITPARRLIPEPTPTPTLPTAPTPALVEKLAPPKPKKSFPENFWEIMETIKALLGINS